MLPTDLPQQRLYLVKGQPVRPPGWSATIIESSDPFAAIPMPKSARYIGQIEWAWSSMNTRIDAYYLSMDRPHRRWLLWIKPYDDNWGGMGRRQRRRPCAAQCGRICRWRKAAADRPLDQGA